MKNILDVLELKIRVMERFTDMWDAVEQNEFEDAMANQFYYLIHNDILESKVNELSQEDKEFMDYLSILAVKGK
jgi:hypothetical protein